MTGDTASPDTKAFAASLDNPIVLKPFDTMELRRQIFKAMTLTSGQPA